MALPATPSNFYCQTANQQILVSWSLSSGATSYIVQRSLDNVTYSTITTISGSPLATQYLDTSVSLGIQYWYKVAASNTSGTSPYTTPASAVAVPNGEKNLGMIRLEAQQKADRVNSNFVTLPEWNDYINRAYQELYGLVVNAFEDQFLATPVQFVTNGSQYLYPIPDGSTTFTNALTGVTFTPPALFKLKGVDLALQTASNAFVTINKFNFIDRNKFVYPNNASTIYGVFNCQYRMMGNNIEFIPTPSGNQTFRLWYIPRVDQLLKDTDTTVAGVNGWIEYVVTRAAKYALDKEESDTTKLDQELLYLKSRIEEEAANRDAGQADTVSDVRGGKGYWSDGSGFNGPVGGF